MFWPWRLKKYQITADELHRRMAHGERFTLIDVRTEGEFYGPDGHLPGARLVPLARLKKEGPAAAGSASPVISVCSRGFRSFRALQVLLQFRPETLSLKGGMTAWNRKGFEVIRGRQLGPAAPPVKQEC